MLSTFAWLLPRIAFYSPTMMIFSNYMRQVLLTLGLLLPNNGPLLDVLCVR